jgi:hypothetical protein
VSDLTRKVDLLPVTASAGIPAAATDLLDEALDLEGRAARVLPGGRLVRIDLGGGRQQHVQVLGVAAVPTGGPGLLLASPCAPAELERAPAMLRLNATLQLGAVELRNVGGADFFVLAATLPVEGLTVEALRRALRFVAERADRLERSLTGGDER